jgi:hypothetical protein
MSIKNLKGMQFGRLTVIEQGQRELEDARRGSVWVCLCQCGTTKTIPGDSLRRGFSKSCGCLHKDKARETCVVRNKSHGDSKSKEYECWKGMKSRCYNKNRENFEHYGAKGITVCEEWVHSFETFLADMGPQPTTDVVWTVERKDKSKPYCKDNCKWETWDKQQRNKGMPRNNKSGEVGVYRINTKNGSPCWVAQWNNLDGTRSLKSFSIAKYGEDLAYELALTARKQAISNLNQQGAGYSASHGK